MAYIAIDTSEYLEHHGILGQKWGVRRTAAQLGHATTSRMRELNSRIEQAKKQHASNVVERNNRKTAKNKAQVAKIESKNEVLRKKAEQEELKQRIKNAKHPDNGSKNSKHEKSIAESAMSGVKAGIAGGINEGTKSLISKAISAAATKHYSDILADPSASAGKKVFADLMGGNIEKSTHNREINDNVNKITRNGAYQRELERRRLAELSES